jgi:[ribosomal protein S5]-alanine N-acetyltransferase
MLGFETNRLLLRHFTVADAARCFRIYQDRETMRFMGSGPRSVTQEQQHIERQIGELYPHGIGLLAVTLKEGQALIGYCGLLYQTVQDKQELEITYLIDRAYWRQGFATEAAQPVVKFWQSSRPEPRLVALVHPDNPASARVVLKNDFIRTGMTPFKTFGVVDLYVRTRA